MQHLKTGLSGSILGTASAIAGAGPFPSSALYSIGAQAAVGATAGVAALSILPFFLGLYPLHKLARQINDKYDKNNPVKLCTAHFLLASSYIVLNQALCISITAAFMSTVNPFTLPIVVAAGASAAILLGLYLLTKPGELSFPGLSFFRAKTKPDTHAAHAEGRPDPKETGAEAGSPPSTGLSMAPNPAD